MYNSHVADNASEQSLQSLIGCRVRKIANKDLSAVGCQHASEGSQETQN